MDEKLKDIFTNINDWLKYAEAKSATLIAGNGVLVLGFSRAIPSPEVNGFILVYLMTCILLCVFSLSICLLSIIPALNMPWDSKPSGVSEKDNVLYFEDIAKYTPNAYLKRVAKSFDANIDGFTGFQTDLANQIIVNSVIAHRKYNYFKVAIWLSLAAVISPLLALLIYFFRSKK